MGQQVEPKFIFDEYGEIRLIDLKEIASIAWGIPGKISYGIGKGIIFSYFETGRGEEGK